MLVLIVGVFMVLHGLVHLLYFGQSRGLFTLQPGLDWPEGSWVFSKLLGQEVIRWLASVACVLAAIGFVAGGVAILAGQAWWRSLVVGSTVFSAVLYVLFWDGDRQKLDGEGGIGLLINIAIVTAVLIFQWPDFGF